MRYVILLFSALTFSFVTAYSQTDKDREKEKKTTVSGEKRVIGKAEKAPAYKAPKIKTPKKQVINKKSTPSKKKKVKSSQKVKGTIRTTEKQPATKKKEGEN